MKYSIKHWKVKFCGIFNMWCGIRSKTVKNALNASVYVILQYVSFDVWHFCKICHRVNWTAYHSYCSSRTWQTSKSVKTKQVKNYRGMFYAVLSTCLQSFGGWVCSVDSSMNKGELDVSYITSRLIVMSYPAEGVESAIKNHIDDVREFLETHHPGSYTIYNLSNRSYRTVKFQNRVHTSAYSILFYTSIISK